MQIVDDSKVDSNLYVGRLYRLSYERKLDSEPAHGSTLIEVGSHCSLRWLSNSSAKVGGFMWVEAESSLSKGWCVHM